MKKFVVVVVAIAMCAGFSGFSYAGDEGWAAAGGFLGGMILGSAMSRPYYGGGYGGDSGPRYYPRRGYYPRNYYRPYYPRVHTYSPYSYPTYSSYGTRYGPTYTVDEYCY